jgi:Regulator of ribonuclease activity B
VSLIRRLFGGEFDGPDDQDAQLIAKLESAGVDLSRPLNVEHFLTLPDERMARQVVAKLASTGGTVRLSPSLMGRSWTVRVAFPMVVTLARITAIREQLGAFAAEHGGEYTGWGTTGD